MDCVKQKLKWFKRFSVYLVTFWHVSFADMVSLNQMAVKLYWILKWTYQCCIFVTCHGKFANFVGWYRCFVRQLLFKIDEMNHECTSFFKYHEWRFDFWSKFIDHKVKGDKVRDNIMASFCFTQEYCMDLWSAGVKFDSQVIL